MRCHNKRILQVREVEVDSRGHGQTRTQAFVTKEDLATKIEKLQSTLQTLLNKENETVD